MCKYVSAETEKSWLWSSSADFIWTRIKSIILKLSTSPEKNKMLLYEMRITFE